MQPSLIQIPSQTPHATAHPPGRTEIHVPVKHPKGFKIKAEVLPEGSPSFLMPS